VLPDIFAFVNTNLQFAVLIDEAKQLFFLLLCWLVKCVDFAVV
jgi:hypothetical protein